MASENESDDVNPIETKPSIAEDGSLVVGIRNKSNPTRGFNYSSKDMVLLTSLLNKYKRSLLMKCTTYMDVATKAEAWKKFTSEYNESSERKRTIKTLQTKVKNMKSRGVNLFESLEKSDNNEQHGAVGKSSSQEPVLKHLRRNNCATISSNSSSSRSDRLFQSSVKCKLPIESSDDEPFQEDFPHRAYSVPSVQQSASSDVQPTFLPQNDAIDKNSKLAEDQHEATMDVLDLKKSNLMLERCLLQKEHEEKMAIFALKKHKLELELSILSVQAKRT